MLSVVLTPTCLVCTHRMACTAVPCRLTLDITRASNTTSDVIYRERVISWLTGLTSPFTLCVWFPVFRSMALVLEQCVINPTENTLRHLFPHFLTSNQAVAESSPLHISRSTWSFQQALSAITAQPFDQTCNVQQQAAVAHVVARSHGLVPYIIFGPPYVWFDISMPGIVGLQLRSSMHS